MILNSKCCEYSLDNNGKALGTLLVSNNIKNINEYKIPFIKKEKLELIKIGTEDYSALDSFIISSLNDYFSKLSTPSDVESKEVMLDKYTKLYELWSKICQKKESSDIGSIQDYYDKISYGLYMLGYDDTSL